MIMPHLLILFFGYLFVLFGGSLFVKILLKRVSSSFVDNSNSGMARAGFYIGILERFIIFTFVLLSQYSAVAFILTAKSIARFEELKSRDYAEYYLIGTLASTAIAILAGIITRILLEGELIL